MFLGVTIPLWTEDNHLTAYVWQRLFCFWFVRLFLIVRVAPFLIARPCLPYLVHTFLKTTVGPEYMGSRYIARNLEAPEKN